MNKAHTAFQGTPYCKQCTKDKVCGLYHVYVIELKPQVFRKSSTFRLENTHISPNAVPECFYVGRTHHKPECRYVQHIAHYKHRKAYARDPKCKPGTMICSCFGGPQERIFKPARGAEFVWGSKIPGRFGKNLRPDLFLHLNPINTWGEAHREEFALAENLRAQGFAASVGGEAIITLDDGQKVTCVEDVGDRLPEQENPKPDANGMSLMKMLRDHAKWIENPPVRISFEELMLVKKGARLLENVPGGYLQIVAVEDARVEHTKEGKRGVTFRVRRADFAKDAPVEEHDVYCRQDAMVYCNILKPSQDKNKTA